MGGIALHHGVRTPTLVARYPRPLPDRASLLRQAHARLACAVVIMAKT
jgi:hypothetical protein